MTEPPLQCVLCVGTPLLIHVDGHDDLECLSCGRRWFVNASGALETRKMKVKMTKLPQAGDTYSSVVMTPKQVRDNQAETLRQAAKLVASVRDGLNTKSIECAHCHLNKAENWPESLIARELDGTIRKLEKLADSFARGLDPGERRQRDAV